MACIIYLLLSILKFTRLLQIRWREVKHPIFNWCEFRILNFQLNMNEFEISLNRKPVWEFHPKSLLNSKRSCLQHVSLVSSFSTKVIFMEDAALKTVNIETWNEQFVCWLWTDRQFRNPTLEFQSSVLFEPINDQVTFFNHITGFNLVTTLSNICP